VLREYNDHRGTYRCLFGERGHNTTTCLRTWNSIRDHCAPCVTCVGGTRQVCIRQTELDCKTKWDRKNKTVRCNWPLNWRMITNFLAREPPTTVPLLYVLVPTFFCSVFLGIMYKINSYCKHTGYLPTKVRFRRRCGKRTVYKWFIDNVFSSTKNVAFVVWTNFQKVVLVFNTLFAWVSSFSSNHSGWGFLF